MACFNKVVEEASGGGNEGKREGYGGGRKAPEEKRAKVVFMLKREH